MGSRLSAALQVLLFILPWRLRRLILRRVLRFEVGDDAFLGYSLIMAKEVRVGRNAHVGHLTVVKNLEFFYLGDESIIGNGNWISGYPRSGASYAENTGRRSGFIMHRHAALTHRHIIDCTSVVTVGEFATVAGYGTQILTHGIDLAACRQGSAPVTVGRYSMVGSRCLLLKGAIVPDFSCLAAGSVVSKPLARSYQLYGGVPARPLRDLEDCLYFTRESGVVP